MVCRNYYQFSASTSFCTVSFFYRTIVYLSIVYAIGQVAMAVSAIHDITDTNHDGKPDNMTFHMWVSKLLYTVSIN